MKVRGLVVLACVVVVCGRSPLPMRAHRDVATRQGPVRGYRAPRHWAFLGIPYAEALMQADRFKAPEAPPRWDGVFEATHRVRCAQASAGDESCLVVNVFVPERGLEPGTAALPVLVHVHDGGFHSGWGSMQPHTRLMEEFVVVTFNYRLGTLGFLCLGTPEAPGNAGLKDQVAALYWVQQNIDSFNGKPADVTVYGTGVGAISIQLLLLSGLTKGLFHKVIMESGSVFAPYSLAYDPLATGLNVAISLGYEDNGNIDELVEFYQNLPLTDAVNVSTNFLPCVENSALIAHSLIDQDPIKAFKANNFEKLPLMVMYTNSEETRMIHKNYDRFTVMPDNFEDLLPNNLKFDSENTKYKIADLVKSFYFEHEQLLKDEIINNYKEYLNDIFMEYPVHKFTSLYASKTSIPVYVMRFIQEEVIGEDFSDIFSFISTAEDLSDDNKAIADRLVSLWLNFIKIGDPTPLTTELVPVLWEPLNPHGLETVEISRPCLHFGASVVMQEPTSSQRLTFWEHIYTKYYRKHVFDGD